MILHITNDYSGSVVYKYLIKGLDDLGISQVVYNPIRDENRVNKNRIEFNNSSSRLIYSLILNNSDRIFYRKKINKICKDIESKIDLSKIKFIHAHTWYSDGGVAYLLSKKYKIPYIVTVRNTDINLFHKYLIHERSFGKEILDKSNNVILISAAYKNRIQELKSLRKIKDSLVQKMLVRPNGIDPFWIKNFKTKSTRKGETVNILFIGKFTISKRVELLQNAVIALKQKYDLNIKLTLIGGGGNNNSKVVDIANSYKDLISFEGKIFDKIELQKFYSKSHIFAMPSKNETFGLVFVEAMLQGLPILYTENEGIDGFYTENIGEKVSKLATVSDIEDKLLLLINNLDNYHIPTDQLLDNHNWDNIVLKFKELYSI